jgi:dipeptidyl aminopeptidase/acylaminoacyl peptidase
MSLRCIYAALGCLAVILSGCHMPKEPRCIPRQVIFGNPARAQPSLSPDGKQLAYLAPVDNVLNIWVKTRGANDDRPITKDKDRGIQQYFWAQDSSRIFYLQDTAGNENWRLYSVNLSSLEVKTLTPFDGVQVNVIEYNRQHPEELLLAMNKENQKFHDLYHLDLQTGRIELIAKNPGDFMSWITDHDLHVRGALKASPDGGCDLLIRDADTQPWHSLVSWGLEDTGESGPVTFDKSGSALYLIDSRGCDTSRLMRMDIRTQQAQFLVDDPAYDIGGVLVNPDTYEIEAVSFFRERADWVVLNAGLQDDFMRIRGIADGDFSIQSRDAADTVWIVAFNPDNGPGAFYLYDRQSKKAEFLFCTMPQLKKYTLAHMEPVSFLSRDGLTLHGYVTYPPGKKKKNLPMVLNVHGGPWARDAWGYNSRSQWLANRGYACLQVNYRGSSGYGKKFLNAGNKEWGGKMHDDLIDAVHWAVRKGIVDPKRIAIFGGSYGGYAALAGATFTPDVFACAVSAVGPSNLITFIKTIPPYWTSYLATIHKRVGNPDTEVEFLKSRSPLFKVDNIKAPVFIAQGANDPRVKKEESEQIVEAMKRKGLYYEYLLFPDEGHGFVKPENRLKFYAAVEKFLARYLGGRFEE